MFYSSNSFAVLLHMSNVLHMKPQFQPIHMKLPFDTHSFKKGRCVLANNMLTSLLLIIIDDGRDNACVRRPRNL